MAYDGVLAERIRRILAKSPAVTEKKMFGGIAFLLRGNMCCGVVGDMLMVRVGPKEYQAALSQPYVGKMDFTGRPLKGFVYVGPVGLSTDHDVREWIDKAVKFALTLPAK